MSGGPQHDAPRDPITEHLRLPLIVAPMYRVSTPAMVVAACRAGVVGSFPAGNIRSTAQLEQWLSEIRAGIEGCPSPGPIAVGLNMRHERVLVDAQCLARARVDIVITSVGPPNPVVAPLHDAGCRVFADVASMRHAEKAIAAGVDGLVLLTSGAGGQPGWANGFAFVRAVRAIYDGPIVLAGGVSDGYALWAARVLGCDLSYMGTRFIATHESAAEERYKQMLVSSRLDDVMLTPAFTGIDSNMLRPSIVAAGLDPAALPTQIAAERADELYGFGGGDGPKRWQDIWSAGHTVGAVMQVCSVHEIIEQTLAEYRAAQSATLALLPPRGSHATASAL